LKDYKKSNLYCGCDRPSPAISIFTASSLPHYIALITAMSGLLESTPSGSKSSPSQSALSLTADGHPIRPKNVKYKTGDIMHATESHLVHQLNCVGTMPAGVAQAVGKAFPWADPYAKRVPKTDDPLRCESESESIPGTIEQFYSQYKPGPPVLTETRQSRATLFEKCLNLLPKVNDLASLAIPYKIGCGIGGGVWRTYEMLILNFAAKHPELKIAVYRLDGWAEADTYDDRNVNY
jgi:hypothetical protein